MSPKIKHLAVYAFIIAAGFTGAWYFLPERNDPAGITTEETPQTKDSLVSATLLVESHDLENSQEPWASSERANSGKKSCRLSKDTEFGVNVRKKFSEIRNFSGLNSISIRFRCFAKDDPDALYVLVVEDVQGKNLAWEGKPIRFPQLNAWNEGRADFQLAPGLIRPDNVYSLYPWNRNKKEFFIDDISISYIGMTAYTRPVNNNGANLFFDFENTDDLTATECIRKTTAHSGTMACDLSDGREFGSAIPKKVKDVSSGQLKKVALSAWIYPLADAPNTVLTASCVNAAGATVFWEGKSTENLNFPRDKWTKLNADFYVPGEKLRPEDVINIGIWNKGKTAVIVDDLEIVFGEQPERRGEVSDIDPASIHNGSFSPRKNRAPFPTIWLQKKEFGDDNGFADFHPDDQFIVANFIGDRSGLDQILWIGQTRQALFMYDLAQKKFKKLWENSNPADSLWNQMNEYSLSSSTGPALLFINSCGAAVTGYVFSGKNWVAAPSKKMAVPCLSKALPDGRSTLEYQGNFSSDRTQTLVWNREWRFDMKLMDGDLILGNVDFKGYAADHNPKYYEDLKIVSGKFTNSKRHTLLIVMANCADKNYSGGRCAQLEDLPALPNKTELYAFPE